MDWTGKKKYPRPDYLSSTRKRLAPQLIYKGRILNGWGKKIAVVVHDSLFDTLPQLPKVSSAEADIAWLIYDLVYDSQSKCFNLTHSRTRYTQFKPALDKITTPEPGDIQSFIDVLQGKLDEELDKLVHTPPEQEPPRPELFEL